MTIRVAAIGTGNVGRHALSQLITDPSYELTGVWVSSPAKAGKDAGELAGLDDSTGVLATNDLDEVLSAEPDCAVYTRLRDDLCRAGRKGDHNHAGLVATAARVVNAIPAVVAAPPGIRTALDLPLITGKGLYAAR